MTNTNIKNLPENAKYFTEFGYSQQYPWVEVKRTPKTVTLAKVIVASDPDWKPEMVPGGFAAHCTNQSSQTWLYDSVDYSDTKTIRATKKGWSNKGTRFVEDMAREFYDYNF